MKPPVVWPILVAVKALTSALSRRGRKGRRLMKPLAALTVADVREHLVWRCHGSEAGDSLATVEPVDGVSLREDDAEVYIAATRFVLGDGSEHVGYCSPQDASGLDYVQPVVLTERGPNPLWFENPLSARAESDWWDRFGRPRSDVFPVSWECLVPVDGTVVRGVVHQSDVFRPATRRR